MSNTKRHEWLANMCLFFGTIIVFFGGIEIILRVTGLQTVKPSPPQIYQTSSNPTISYELRPSIEEKAYRSTVSTNTLGLRGKEVNRNYPVIPVIGDSITFVYGLEDSQSIHAVLYASLSKYTVVNVGTPGYHLAQQTAVYTDKVAPLNPAAAVLIFHFNDLEESGTAWLDDTGIIRAEGWEPTGPDCNVIRTGPLQHVPGQCWLDQHSAFYKAVKKVITSRGSQKSLEESRAASRSNIYDDPVTIDQLNAYAQQLDQLVAAFPHNLPRLFVIWPERSLHFKSRPQLTSIAEQRGFRVIDLYEVFGNQAQTLGWDSVHPSAKTAKEGAMAIKAALEHFNIIASESL